MSTGDLNVKWKLTVMNILYDLIYDEPDESTKEHLMRLYRDMEQEPAVDSVSRIADEVFGNLPHGGE